MLLRFIMLMVSLARYVERGGYWGPLLIEGFRVSTPRVPLAGIEQEDR